MFENKVVNSVVSIYFMAVAVLMYFFLTQHIIIGVGFSYRHLFALLLVFSAFMAFLVKPNVARAVISLKSSLVLSIPLLLVITVSLLIWTINHSDFDTILRGLSTSVFFTNWMSSALAAGVMLYIFGEKGIWYNLGAILIANLIMIGQIMITEGVGIYMSELFELIKTFAGTTGKVIMQAEIHELAFCLGAYLVYMLLKPRKEAWFWILFAFLAFCFVSALKRIAVIAIAVALIFAIILLLIRRFSPKIASVCLTMLMVVLIISAVAYVGLTRAGMFTLFESGGMNTMGRGDIYDRAKEFYKFSPMFLGNGIGFLNYQLTEARTVGVNAIHNDYLQLFIDLGFWGYLLWLISMTFTRIKYFEKKSGIDAAIICFAVTIYLFICSATDNTMNYPLVTTVVAIIIMGNGFDRRVEEYREKSRVYKGIEL